MKKFDAMEHAVAEIFNPELLDKMAQHILERFPDAETTFEDEEYATKYGASTTCLMALSGPEGVYHFANALVSSLFEDDKERDYHVLYYLKHLFQKVGDML